MTKYDFLDKLPLYNTAFSPLHDCFVQIRKVRLDVDDEPIIHATLQNTDQVVLFRRTELTNYCN